MGKILKAIAIIAIAVAIAYFAPQLGLTALHALGSTAAAGGLAATIATTVVGAALSIAAGAAFQAIAGAAPDDAASGLRKPVMVRDKSGLNWLEQQPAAPVLETLQPIDHRGIRYRHFFPWQRWSIERAVGECMRGTEIEGSRWLLLDRRAAIAPGSFFAFNIDDMWTAYQPGEAGKWWKQYHQHGLYKRYLGTDPEWGRIIFECTNPPAVYETGRNRVRWAYAIVAYSPSLAGILKKWWCHMR